MRAHARKIKIFLKEKKYTYKIVFCRKFNPQTDFLRSQKSAVFCKKSSKFYLTFEFRCVIINSGDNKVQEQTSIG